MVRRYLDEIVPVNSGIIGRYISPVGPFSEPMYAMVDNDTVADTPAPTRTRSSKSKKKKSNKPKNDGIIRNHDSVWDYKIQDGKLLTRRKSSDGKWYDITSNDEARSRIESFTGRSIGTKSKKEQPTSYNATTPSTQSTDTTQVSDTIRHNRVASYYTQQPGYNQDSGRPIIAVNVPSLEDILYGGAEFPNKRRSLKTEKSSNVSKSESDIAKEYIARNISRTPISRNFLNRNIGDAIPLLGTSVYDQIWANRAPSGPYINLMEMLGINPMLDERYYPMI